MADNINISGLNGVREWSTEETLQQVFAEMVKSNASLTSIKNAINIIKTVVTNNTTDFERLLGELDETGRNDNNRNDNNRNDNNSNSSKGIKIPSFVSVINEIFSDLANVWGDQLRVFGNLHENGVIVSDGFRGMATSMSLMNLSLSDYYEVLKKYSATVNKYGEKKFAKAASNTSALLESFGFVAKESADTLGTYLQMQTLYGNVRKLSDDAASDAAINFGIQLDDLSKITGLSREQMKEQLLQANKSLEVWTFMQTVPESLRTQVKRSFDLLAGTVTDPALLSQMQKMATAPFIQLDQTYQTLVKSGNRGLADMLATFADRVKSGAITSADEMEVSLQAINTQLANADFSRLMELNAAAIPGAEDTLRLVMSMRATAGQLSTINKKDREESQKIAESKAKLNNALSDIRGSFDRTFFASAGFFETLSRIAKGVGDLFNPAKNPALGTISDSLRRLFGNIVGGLGDASADVVDTVVGYVRTIMDSVAGGIKRFVDELEKFTEAGKGDFWDFMGIKITTMLQSVGDSMFKWLGEKISDAFVTTIQDIVLSPFRLMGSIAKTLSSSVAGLLSKFGFGVSEPEPPAQQVVGAKPVPSTSTAKINSSPVYITASEVKTVQENKTEIKTKTSKENKTQTETKIIDKMQSIADNAQDIKALEGRIAELIAVIEETKDLQASMLNSLRSINSNTQLQR